MSFGDDNPFEDPSVRAQMAPSSYNQPPATLPAQQASYRPPPPAYTNNQPPLTNDALLRRQEELEAKAAELQRKEQEIKEQQRQAASMNAPRVNNFPPIPSFIPIEPCFYQDFDMDIPEEFRHTVKLVYYVWMIFVLTLILNWIGTLLLFSFANGGFAIIIKALIYLVAATPCSYITWFRFCYKAFRSDSSFHFFLFFFTFFIQICACGLFAIGLSDFATCGWLTAFDVYDTSVFTFLYVLVVALMFTLCAIAMGFLLQRVHALYKTTGATFEKAQQEFSSNMMRNQHVQRAAGSAAKNAASAAFSGGN